MSGDGAQTETSAAADATDAALDRVLVLNPTSGNGDHRDRVRGLADEYDYTVLETQADGETVAFGRIAGLAGADLVAAAGGDGTVNEVVRGLDSADALDETTVGVVPAGTGNNFAQNVGVEDVRHAFEVAERGERRRIDVATADDRLFLNSCLAGVTADASASTSSEMKDRLGVLAYVVSGLRTVADFDALPLAVEATGPEGEETWDGEAVMVLVGNARRFPAEGRSQADVEDGLLDVTIVERTPPRNLLEEAAVQRLFGEDTESVTRLLASELDVTVRRDEPVGFSFDGEIGEYRSLAIRTRPKALELCVGDDYEPDPE
ncbi:diacylglycerol kinase family lipid kinase [Halorussus salilacus]|uniref:diacylglycerol/lipid kinase family protein n=1 Tax=Halorussus salilacus TaxID=2953750 RepID=UPI00209E8AC0|nr:diacylglycerol kinase family protein [Halorussus salilacus]USZ67560.1 diacylglycerol kinase family lipid kinase [Halorussus salilacus]